MCFPGALVFFSFLPVVSLVALLPKNAQCVLCVRVKVGGDDKEKHGVLFLPSLSI